jgi:Sulfatase
MPSKKLRTLKAMRSQWAATFALLFTILPGAVYSQQLAKKPNILVIMGDDIGWFNASCYNHGMMGYQTPNIDRIAAEGGSSTLGTDSKVVPPVVPRSLPADHQFVRAWPRSVARSRHRFTAEDPSVAELLKPLGYATGQFGKNHLGDKDEFLPTKHGFDEFFGNLYQQDLVTNETGLGGEVLCGDRCGTMTTAEGRCGRAPGVFVRPGRI